MFVHFAGAWLDVRGLGLRRDLFPKSEVVAPLCFVPCSYFLSFDSTVNLRLREPFYSSWLDGISLLQIVIICRNWLVSQLDVISLNRIDS